MVSRFLTAKVTHRDMDRIATTAAGPATSTTVPDVRLDRADRGQHERPHLGPQGHAR